MLALVHKADPGRRHLIVGMTDREDCGSVIPSSIFLDVAGRSDAVMHLVDYSGGGGDSHYRVRSCTPRARPDGEAIITQAAERTGGELHKQSRFFRSSSIARAFKTIFDDFRQSYVLRYSPHDVSSDRLASHRRAGAESEGRDDPRAPGLLRRLISRGAGLSADRPRPRAARARDTRTRRRPAA